MIPINPELAVSVCARCGTSRSLAEEQNQGHRCVFVPPWITTEPQQQWTVVMPLVQIRYIGGKGHSAKLPKHTYTDTSNVEKKPK